jgi:hypothetical protein
VWDAENRLKVVFPTAPTANSKKLAFTYDYMNRRVRKQVFDWDVSAGGGAGAWSATPSKDLQFVYDQWNLLIDLDGLNGNAVLRKYTWGLDLSGSLYGAGGVGGLLAVGDSSVPEGGGHYIYFYDANGNVGQVIQPFTVCVERTAREPRSPEP